MENKNIKIILIIIAGAIIFFPKIIGFSVISQKIADRPFEGLNLEAKAVFVFDLASQKPIFEFNSNAQLPLASLTKIMTVVVAEETKTKDISSLVDKALMQSKNEAASALALLGSSASKSDLEAKLPFIDLMNKKAQELELNQTYFLNETGLDISKQTAGALGSASDIVKLVVYALNKNPDFFEATLTDSYLNTNPFATTTTLLIASKTGLTDLAGGNLAVVFDAGFNHPVISVILGSSEKGRFTDTKKLINATFKYLARN